jgi:hypothetical protein
MDMIIYHENRKKREILSRNNILKLVVSRIIEEIRLLRRKPKLGDILAKFRGMPKEIVLGKVMMLFSNEVQMNKENVKFDKIMDSFLRISKIFTINAQAITQIENEVDTMNIRK